MKPENIPFRLESELVKRWHRFTNGRPVSDPYLSGDSYRALTSWRFEFETRVTWNPSEIRTPAVVFCDAWKLTQFLQNEVPKIEGLMTVVSSNGDPNFTPDKLVFIPPNVSHLWVQNCDVRDPRVHPLPIGLENARFHTNGIVRDFHNLRKKNSPKINRILWGFAEVTNPVVRGAAREALERCSLADRLHPVNSRLYRKTAQRYRFIASPPGNGIDCHRTWEALYLRSVPIVLRSAATESFASLGLPLWLVDSYEELVGVTEEQLEQRYAELVPGFECPALWMDYWRTEILKHV